MCLDMPFKPLEDMPASTCPQPPPLRRVMSGGCWAFRGRAWACRVKTSSRLKPPLPIKAGGMTTAVTVWLYLFILIVFLNVCYER